MAKKDLKKQSRTFIGILFRDEHIYISKSRKSENRIFLQAVQIFTCNRERKDYENLNVAIEKLGREFFEDAHIAVAVQFSGDDFKKVLLPPLSKKDLEKATAAQVEDINNVVWDSLVVGQVKSQDAIMNDTVILKIPIADIDGFIKLFDHHNIYLNKIFNEPIALVYSVQKDLFKDMIGCQLILDLDHHFLKIFIFKDHKLVFMRYVPLGFDEFIQALSRKITVGDDEIEVNSEKAEELMNSLDLFDRDPESDWPLDHLFFLLRPNLEKVSIEVKKSVSFYGKQTSTVTVKRAVLFGEFLKIRNIGSYFADELGFDVLDPHFDDDFFGGNLGNDASRNVGMCLSLATGNSDLSAPFFNFLPAYYVNRPKTKRVFKLMSVLVGLWIVVQFIILFQHRYREIDMTSQLKEKQDVIAALNAKKESISKQKKLNVEKSKQILFLTQIEKARIPLEDLYYELGQLAVPGMFLSSIEIKENRLIIEGGIVQSKSQLMLTEYMSGLEQLGYLNNIDFEITKGLQHYSIFRIEGHLSPIGTPQKGNAS